ncbi:MAG: N-acetylgalactosamine 6-sulfate sulfatase (GALNS) [Isosphaera sp.]|nr:N-acetylgalactosamine 6-sulfate sulfatase (GALNS) [Isosphaera sp.]
MPRLLPALAALALAAPAAAADKPNVVFILADDLGWGDLGCYGNKFVKTPNLDRLAGQGTLFTHFYVTGSVCSPSRCGFLTGQFPGRHALHGHLATPDQNKARAMPDWLDPNAVTLPRLLKSAGYATAHVGKWHLGSGKDAPHPREYGFDLVKSVNAADATWRESPDDDPYFRAKSSTLFVDEGIKFVEANKGKPFYLQLWMLVPHATLNPTPEQLKQYDQFAPGGKDFPHAGARPVFYASVTDLDTQVGRLMKALDDLGVADNTLVVFSSDNGPEEIFIKNAGHSGVGSPGPFRGRKRSLYEGGVRVPFLVRWPKGTPAGRVDDGSVVSGADFLPSVCKLAGVDLPAGYTPDGEDRSAVLAGKPGPRTKPLFWEWRFRIMGHVSNVSPTVSVRDGKWKLLLNPDRSRVELYDIPADSGELRNVADRHPEVVEKLAKQALAWQATLPKGPSDPDAGSDAYPWPKAPAPKKE